VLAAVGSHAHANTYYIATNGNDSFNGSLGTPFATFTKAINTAHAIESGWVQINQGLGQFPGQSYGGYKQRGMGREYSLEGMLDSYTQRKSVTINLQW